MPESKRLSFKFELDTASFQRVKSALQELTREASKFAQALQGRGGGGAGGIQPNAQFANLLSGGQVGGQASGAQLQAAAGPKSTITAAIQDNVAAFKNLSQFGGFAMKGLSEAMKKSAQDQQQSIRGLQGALDALVRTYEKLGGPGGGAVADRVAVKMAGVAGKLNAQRQALAALPPTGVDPLPEVPWPGQTQAAAQRSRFAQWLHTPGGAGPDQFFGGAIQGIAPTTMGGLMRMGGTALVGANAIINEGFAGSRMYGNIESQRGNVVAAMNRAMMGGDITYLDALREMNKDSTRRKDLAAQVGRPEGVAMSKMGALWDIGKTAIFSGPALAAAKAGIAVRQVGQGRDIVLPGEDWAHAAAAARGIKTAAGNVIGLGGAGPGASVGEGLTGESQETFLMGMGVSEAERYRQGVVYQQRLVALQGFQGSLGARTQAARIMGLGLSRKRRGGVILDEGQDTFLTEQARLMRMGGYDVGEKLSAVAQSRQLGLGGAYSDEIMRASAGGWGQWGGILAGAAAVGGRVGMTGGALARTALGATANTAAGMQLGQMAFQYDPRGMTSGIGLLAAAQGGADVLGLTGGPGDMLAVQRVQQGLAAGDRLAGGFDPYQQGRNLVSAMQVAPGLSTYGQDYLATGMNFKQQLSAARGDLTETAKAMGISPEMVKAQLAAQGTSVFDRFVDQGGSGPLVPDLLPPPLPSPVP